MTEPRFLHVGRFEDFPDGELSAVDVGEEEVLVVRLGDAVYAVRNLCSHAEGWLDMGRLHRESCEVECPLHEGRFDLRTGAPTHEPCTEPIPSYPVRVEGGNVLVAVGA